MFDIQKILKRAWQILWSYRMLWVFGFILALSLGGRGAGNNSRYSISDRERQPSSNLPAPGEWRGLEGENIREILQDGLRQMGNALQAVQEQYPLEFRMVIAALITFLALMILLSLLTAILRYVAEMATIRMVDEYEQSGVKVGFRQGWKYGWSRAAWRAFLVNFLVHLPVLALFVVLGMVGWWILSALINGGQWEILSSLVAGIGLAFLSLFLTVILMVLLNVLRDFAWRMIALENAGVWQSLRQAFDLVKRQWKNVGLMWLVMVGLKIAWTVALIILIIPLLIVSLLTAVGGLLVAILPSLATAGIASLFSAPDYWPWVFAAIIGLPLFIVITFSPFLLVSGWTLIFQSSVWTLTYRELKALEAVAAEGELEELGAV
jgi:hypothetical protein